MLIVDVRGLACPLPVLRASKALRPLAAGDALTVLASDPAAARDFESFCAATGHVLVSRREEDGALVFVLRKAG
jgi:tRNA 2-thiouridine synthesizing protein A